MTKKDYELIAQIIKATDECFKYEENEVSYCEVLEEVTQRFVNRFKADNPRFDGHKFIAACGF